MKTITFEGKEYVLDYVSGPGRKMPSTDVIGDFRVVGTFVDKQLPPERRFKGGFLDDYWNNGQYRVYKLAPKRSHKNKPRKTALERARSIVTLAPLTPSQLAKLVADVEKQIQLAVEAAFQRKARKNDR